MRWPKSLRWRYSLRALLVFITLFMIWGGYHANRGWRQRAAEAVLRKHGAVIGYGKWTDQDRDFVSRVARTYEVFVHRLWGDRYINSVFINSPLEPDVVDALVSLPQLPMLSLYCDDDPHAMSRTMSTGVVERKAKMPNGALRRILERHQIEQLWLSMCILDDSDCRTIAAEPSLWLLQIFGADLSEEGLADLVATPSLHTLKLSYCPVRGDDLHSVPGSTSLRQIECEHTPVGPEFGAFVGRSPNVATLSVALPGVDDGFIERLGPHRSLTQLGLAGRGITDRSVKTLQEMRSLKYLSVPKRSLSDDAIGKLSRPDLKLVTFP